MISSVPGFWWGWPAGVWTAGTPSTPVSSPASSTSLTGSARSKGAHVFLTPALLFLRPSFHTALCKLWALQGLAEPQCLHTPGSHCCLCSGPGSRPVVTRRAPLLLLSASGPSLHAGTFPAPLPQPTSSQWFLLLCFPAYLLLPLKPSLQKQNKSKKGSSRSCIGAPLPLLLLSTHPLP